MLSTVTAVMLGYWYWNCMRPMAKLRISTPSTIANTTQLHTPVPAGASQSSSLSVLAVHVVV